MVFRFVYYSALLLCCSGCLLHDIDKEPLPLADLYPKYSEPIIASLETPSQSAELPWWLSYGDLQLNDLISEGLASNLDVAQAEARLRQADALVVQARARRLPFFDLGARSQIDVLEGEGAETRTLMGGILSWELDFFGRLEAGRLARFYERRGFEAERELSRLLLSGAIAQTWYGAIEQRQQLELLRRQVKTDRELLTLTERRFEAGIASRADVLQQMGQAALTETLIPTAESALWVLENRLDVLLGKSVDGAFRTSDQHSLPSRVPLPDPGVPSELLLRRPDLQNLKARLIAADAEIAQAMAERLPSVMLDANLGFVGGSQASGFSTQVLPSLLQPFLDWGLRRAEVKRSEAFYAERIFEFTQAYLEAAAEVENLLYQIAKQKEFIVLLEKRKQILSETVEETQKRYTGGLTDYLPVLDALQELRAVERELVRQARELVFLSIDLAIAVGGGQLPEYKQNENSKMLAERKKSERGSDG